MNRVKVLMVDDSPTIREHLASIIMNDPRLLLIGEAKNGEEAVRMAQKLKPDVISMDVHMPVMNGLDSVKEIMRVQPTPIVVVSGSMNSSEMDTAFNAIRVGALAVIGKPPAPNHPGYVRSCRELLDTLHNMSQVAVIHRWGTTLPERKPLGTMSPLESDLERKVEVVGIASSTGGPSALAEILSSIPANFPVPIVIVQHISENFEGGLVDWLGRVSYLEIAVAQEGQRLQPGQVLIAPSNKHLRIRRGGYVTLDTQRGDMLNFPSANIMLQSLAQTYGGNAAGVILTGMGDDGALGIRAIYDAGGRTIAQDKETSVVFGMPHEAIQLGAVNYVLPVQKIARVLMSLVTPAALKK